jgi:cytochrome oxidase Cu insertion factor (SCO1/SenC/PrrC family)
MTEGKKKNGRFQLIALFLMLICLPAVSWYYLRSGLDYRIATMEELQELGELSGFEIKIDSQNVFKPSDLKGNVIVAAFIKPQDSALGEQFGGTLQKLRDQFKDTERVKFLLHDLAGNQGNLSQFADQYLLSNQENVQLLSSTSAQMAALAKDNYRLPEATQENLSENPYLVLVDTSSVIRNYYDVRELAQVQKLVGHITHIMPPTPKKDIILKREKEK